MLTNEIDLISYPNPTQKMPTFAETFVGTIKVLQVLIETYGPKKWNWTAIYANPNLTFEMIKDYYLRRKVQVLNWEEISENKAVTMEHVKAHPLWPWSIEGLSRNPNLTLEFVKEHSEENWNWWSISGNDEIVMELIELFPDKDWDWEQVSWCDNLTIKFIEKHPEKPWNWENMSHNDDFVTPEIVEAHLDKPWDWSALTGNRQFTMEYIESHLDFPWIWRYVCQNNNLTAEFFKRYLHKITEGTEYNSDYWFVIFDESPNLINETMILIKEIPNLRVCWWEASRNFPIHFIDENPNLPWEWDAISGNTNLTPAFIEKNVGIVSSDWDWTFLSRNPAVTMDFVERHQEESYKWDWSSLSCNPNITFEFIQKHSKKLDFKKLSRNEFLLENRKNKQRGNYALLEKERTLPTLVNSHVISKYM